MWKHTNPKPKLYTKPCKWEILSLSGCCLHSHPLALPPLVANSHTARSPYRCTQLSPGYKNKHQTFNNIHSLYYLWVSLPPSLSLSIAPSLPSFPLAHSLSLSLYLSHFPSLSLSVSVSVSSPLSLSLSLITGCVVCPCISPGHSNSKPAGLI